MMLAASVGGRARCARTEVIRAISGRPQGSRGLWAFYAGHDRQTCTRPPELLEVLGGGIGPAPCYRLPAHRHLARLARLPYRISSTSGYDIAECGKLTVKGAKAVGEKCERCWIYSDELGSADPEHPTLQLPRCAAPL